MKAKQPRQRAARHQEIKDLLTQVIANGRRLDDDPKAQADFYREILQSLIDPRSRGLGPNVRFSGGKDDGFDCVKYFIGDVHCQHEVLREKGLELCEEANIDDIYGGVEGIRPNRLKPLTEALGDLKALISEA